MDDVPEDSALHVYGQGIWHAPAYLVGTREALGELRERIEDALDNPRGVSQQATWTSDGEGYTLHIVVAREEAMDTYRLPYTDTMARDTRPNVREPGEHEL